MSDWSKEKYDTLMNDLRHAVQEHIAIVGELDRGIQALCAMRNRMLAQERN